MDKGFVQRVNFLRLIFFLLTSFTMAEAVVGGENAKPGEFPHSVKLVNKFSGDIYCGGSILTPDVVLTAAYCVYLDWFLYDLPMPPELIWVAAGGVKLGENKKAFGKEMEQGEQLITVSHYFVYPNYYNYYRGPNDIALLFLKEPFNYTKNISPIQLPSSPNQTFSEGVFSGWGSTGKDTPSLHLKKLSLALNERDSCNEGFTEEKVTETELCSKFEKGVGTCKQGDSGGSLVCQEQQSSSLLDLSSNETRWSPVICGISAKQGGFSSCGETPSVVTFTDVRKYLDWINDTMESKRLPNSVKKVNTPSPLVASNCSKSRLALICGIHGYTCMSVEEICDWAKDCQNDEPAKLCQSINEWSLPDSGNESLATTAGNESEPNSSGGLTIFLWFLGFAILGGGLIVGVIYFKKEMVKPVDSFV